MAGLAVRRAAWSRRPRSLVRSGIDVGPWLVANDITVVSTVPTLVALWPDGVAGPGAPADPGRRGRARPSSASGWSRPDREVWNTYGPTEATVVACGALLTARRARSGSACRSTAGTWPSSTPTANPVAPGETGELIIGGVGLARYLDPAKDAEKYAPMPTLGLGPRLPQRRPRACNDPAGLLFAGRADDQVKLGGRRIELGEVDNALLALPGVIGAAAAVRRTGAGNQLLVGYVDRRRRVRRAAAAMTALRGDLPAALVPRLASVDDLPDPDLGQGRPRRAALAAAAAGVRGGAAAALDGTAGLDRRAVARRRWAPT